MYMGYLWRFSVQGHFGVTCCTCHKMACKLKWLAIEQNGVGLGGGGGTNMYMGQGTFDLSLFNFRSLAKLHVTARHRVQCGTGVVRPPVHTYRAWCLMLSSKGFIYFFFWFLALLDCVTRANAMVQASIVRSLSVSPPSMTFVHPPSVKHAFSETLIWVNAKFCGQVGIDHISRCFSALLGRLCQQSQINCHGTGIRRSWQTVCPCIFSEYTIEWINAKFCLKFWIFSSALCYCTVELLSSRGRLSSIVCPSVHRHHFLGNRQVD